MFFIYWKKTDQRITTLIEDNATAAISLQVEKYTLEQTINTYKLQTRALISLAEKNKTLGNNVKILATELLKHNLEKLADVKPKLIEGIINEGTKKVFSDFNAITNLK